MAYFEYKCRRCGLKEHNPWCNNDRAITQLIFAVHDISNKEPQAPTMYSIHSCNDGGTGVSDLMGFTKEPEERIIDHENM